MRSKSYVLSTPAAPSPMAQTFFASRLSYETDPAGVYLNMQHGVAGFVVLDVRSPEAYTKSHVPGAINLPQVMINAETTAQFSKETLFVVYCWGPGCNGATKAAVKLRALGFLVQEMIGGIESWEDKERYPIERGGRQ